MSIYKLEITIPAEEEYASAFHYYEKQQQGLGRKFEKETDRLIEQLKLNPYLFQRKFKHYREAIFRIFPYFIVYEIVNETIFIHSFFHTSRNPKKKLKRQK